MLKKFICTPLSGSSVKKIAHRDVPTRLGVPTWFGSMIAKNLGKVELHLDELQDLVLALVLI